MAWRLEFEGEVYREHVDLTLDQVVQIEELTGDNWLRVAPLKSAKHARAVLAVLVAHRTGISVDDALAKVGALSPDAYLDLISVESMDEQLNLPSVYEEGVPKAGGASATT